MSANPSVWRELRFDECVERRKTPRSVSSIPQTDYHAEGRYPIMDQGASYVAGWTDSKEHVISQGLPVIIFGDHTRTFKYVDFPFAVGADGTRLIWPQRETFDPLFLYFALLNLEIPSRGYNRHYRLLREM